MLKRSLLTSLAVFTLLTIGGSLGRVSAKEKELLCHRTSDINPDGSVHYQLLPLPPTAITAHLDEHGNLEAGDFFPNDEDCDVTNDGGTTGTPDPGATPEPITVLLFGAGVAGAGYATRRLRKNRSKS